jgi:hypothetical protein
MSLSTVCLNLYRQTSGIRSGILQSIVNLIRQMTDTFFSTLIRLSKLGHAEEKILPSFQLVLSDCIYWLSEGACRLGSGFCVGVDFPILRRHPKSIHTGSSTCNIYQIVGSILFLCRLNTNGLPYALFIGSEKLSNALQLTKWKTYVTQTTALLYNLSALICYKAPTYLIVITPPFSGSWHHNLFKKQSNKLSQLYCCMY